LVEQLIRNQQVRGSSPRAGSSFPKKTSTAKIASGFADPAIDGLSPVMVRRAHLQAGGFRE
jgi:hypothetical protein